MRKFRSVLSLIMALIMIASLPVAAFAEDVTVVDPAVDNGDGTSTVVTTITSTDTDAEGNTTVTVTIEKATDGVLADGTVVDRDESRADTTISDENGFVLGESFVEDGKETTTKLVEEDSGSEPGQPDVTVDLEPGKTTTGIAGETTVTGDVPTDENDKNYDYTTTTNADRTVTAETTQTVVKTEDNGLVEEKPTDLKGVAPVYDMVDGKKEDKGGMFDSQFDSGERSKYANPDNWVMPEGTDVRYVGTGEHSKYYVAVAYVEYEKDENGNTIYDENGAPIIKELRRYADENSGLLTIDGEVTTELPEGVTLQPFYDNNGGSRPFIFMMMDKNKNKFYGYCCDLETDTMDGYYYTMSNLEDSSYYASEESADHIRAVLMNGYWGTTGTPNEDGSHAFGSLELIKDKLKETITSGAMENTVIETQAKDASGNLLYDENGEPIMESKTMLECIDRLTSGEALLATQAAVWTFANGSYDFLNGKDASIVIDPDSYTPNHNPKGNSKSGEAMDDYASAAVDFLYSWLINLSTEQDSTVIINDKNFVEDMSLTVHDKVADHENNLDDNNDNDVYNTDLNFKLAFVPGEDDDLLVQISYTDLDGNPVNIVRRLAGENAEGQSYEDILPEEDGSYVLKGLKLSENEDFNFDLRLEGTQYLEKGVYIYEAHGGREKSQNFVGVAEGNRNVDVSIGVTVSFDVDENNMVVAERSWHSEGDPNYEPPVEIIPEPVPLAVEPDGGEDEIVIEEEPVPLAQAPSTGSSAIIYAIAAAASGMGLAGLNILKKRED